MKAKKIKVLINFLFILALFLAILSTPIFAADLRIETDDLEFEITPQNQPFLNITNMTPGDSISSQLTIINNFKNEIEVSMRAEGLEEEATEDAPDLYRQIHMTVSFDGEVIHEGPMIDFASDQGINLGFWNPGEVKDLMVEATLPEETGNEFMGLSHSHRWIFTVGGEEIVIIEDEDPPLGPIEEPEEPVIIEDEEVPLGGAKLPQTGGIPAALFLIAGAIIVTTGMVLKKEKD